MLGAGRVSDTEQEQEALVGGDQKEEGQDHIYKRQTGPVLGGDQQLVASSVVVGLDDKYRYGASPSQSDLSCCKGLRLGSGLLSRSGEREWLLVYGVALVNCKREKTGNRRVTGCRFSLPSWS